MAAVAMAIGLFIEWDGVTADNLRRASLPVSAAVAVLWIILVGVIVTPKYCLVFALQEKKYKDVACSKMKIDFRDQSGSVRCWSGRFARW